MSKEKPTPYEMDVKKLEVLEQIEGLLVDIKYYLKEWRKMKKIKCVRCEKEIEEGKVRWDTYRHEYVCTDCMEKESESHGNR